jgi:hypothetical protein
MSQRVVEQALIPGTMMGPQMVPLPTVLNMKQLATYAGVCQDTLRGWMSRERDPLPHMRLSDSKYSKPLFRRDLFDEWQRRQMTDGMIQEPPRTSSRAR